MIRHTVVFTLKHQPDSTEETEFLEKAAKLERINVVNKFEILRQVSAKNSFQFGLSMEFSSQTEYDYYNEHPDHLAFVEQVWLKEVEDFMEIDYKVLDLTDREN
ncbi:Dabb family protein [Catenovulum adriaticum]|uniref:Dabb family protein n=1 Tax=Catenovulum adriaticum TaxID=2984846 RepID=A0ABY7AKY2_9ALTE|nr:Dabb family protein [Catenovulum sp. TS8]WAJ69932.1 Dabb family protein [Catenovulum sp. TS8]